MTTVWTDSLGLAIAGVLLLAVAYPVLTPTRVRVKAAASRRASRRTS